MTYRTPQTEDGRIVSVNSTPTGEILVDIQIPLTAPFRERVAGRFEHIRFASRSRIARLGINIQPIEGYPQIGDDSALVRAKVRTFVGEYGIAPHLKELIVPGIPAGRLVFCDPERRLSAEQVYEAYSQHAFQLPARFSIDSSGRVRLQPHRCVYDLAVPVRLDDLIAVVARNDGAVVLNRMQVRRPVEHIILKPGDGAITSCTMFLHRHFIVLDPESTDLGKHLQAIVLDPVTTRGSRVYLEFANSSNTTIVNPWVAATIYLADPVPDDRRTWYGAPAAKRSDPSPPESENGYRELVRLYDRLDDGTNVSYLNRPVAVFTDVRKTLAGAPFIREWKRPRTHEPTSVEILAARQRAYSDIARLEDCGTRILKEVPDGSRSTMLLRYFPNLPEHLDVCHAAMSRKIERLIFRDASFEHGPFLSAHDHGRLADYEALGLEVLWCNDVCRHVARHVFRGIRGYFSPIEKVDRFRNALIVALYGSTRPLSADEAKRLASLLTHMREFFGDNMAVLTGGGPGAMAQSMEIARGLGLLTGSSFLELVDQRMTRDVDFYQTFQENSRHSRQRWFEISSFQVFCVGGVGTLEEIGLTLTDMKLGVMDPRPVIFFGSRGNNDTYWSHLREQLYVMVDEQRAPAWVRSHILMTDDPAEAIAFCQQLLQVG